MSGCCKRCQIRATIKQVAISERVLPSSKCGEEAIRAAEYRLILTNYPERQEISFYLPKSTSQKPSKSPIADVTPRSVVASIFLLITGIKKASVYAGFSGYTLP